MRREAEVPSPASKQREPMNNNKAFDRCRWMYQGALFAILLAVPAIQTQAQVNNLSVQGSTLQVSVGGSSPGLSDWTVGGVNQLDYQWFYYSVGVGTLNSIDNISAFTTPSITTTATSETLAETYANATLSLTAQFELEAASSPSGLTKLATTIVFQNLSSSAQTLNLYQFSDFDLGNTLGGQTVQFAGTGMPYSVTQSGAVGGPLTGSLSAGFATVNEAAGVEDGNQLGIKTGNANPNLNDSSLSATGAVDFGYEISETLNPNQSIIISELQSVPEPSTMALIFSGMLAFGLFCGRKLVSFKKVEKKASI